MEEAQEITLDYLRVRKQFGKLIGSFQALQHQAVNIYIKTETVRSLVFQIAAANDPYRIDPALAVAVKAKASEDALCVTETCIQLHGAIGFTDEHDIGLYLKRAMLLSSLFGNAAAQRQRYAAIAALSCIRLAPAGHEICELWICPIQEEQAMTEQNVVTYELEGEIALVGLNRPDKRNCFNPDCHEGDCDRRSSAPAKRRNAASSSATATTSAPASICAGRQRTGRPAARSGCRFSSIATAISR